MLVKCPECSLQVSDKAITCPHCGYPLKEPSQRKRALRKKHHEHRRLPNGFGRITKINRNLANPYRVMVTSGHDENGRPIGKLLKPKAYFPTYNDAYMALVEYNRKPYELDNDTTMAELYDRWFASVENTVAKITLSGYRMCWNYCSSIYNVKVRDVRIRHIRYCMERGSYEKDGIIKAATPSVKNRVKLLLNMLLDYAVEYELVDRNIARSVKLPKAISQEIGGESKHICFTESEMLTLWKNLGKIPYVNVILLQCYSGWRPQELGLIKLSNVDLEKWTFKGGLKTRAGKERVVPIHTCIRPIVKALYEEATELNSDFLINATDSCTLKLSYDKYNDRFKTVITELNMNPEHKPHDPRKQFVTMANEARVNEYAIKRIVGHSVQDVTEKFYTERSPAWLSEEIEKIKVPVIDA